MSSVVKVTCISAQLTRDTQMFSNMDPYVIVQCGSEKRKTRTHQEGGKKPLWNDTFSFANPKSQNLKFAVWDEDNITDDLVGQGVLDITKFTQTPNLPSKQYISLTYKKKPAGKLYVEIIYQSNNQANYMGGNNNMGWNNTNNNTFGSGNNNTWNNTNNNGWTNQNNTNQRNTQTNTNGWGSQQNINQQPYSANQNQPAWNPQQNNNQGWGQNANQPPYQSNNNSEVNPYGNTSVNNNLNPYPSLNDPKPNNNPLEFVIGANLLGQQHLPPQQSNPNALNILDMAVKGAISPQINSGWNQPPQQPNQWNQPPQQPNQWNQPQQNQGWGQPNQPSNPWQNNNKPNNGWGSGW